MCMKYVKLPIVIDAIQFDGNNTDKILQFVGSCGHTNESDGTITIYTLEGYMKVSKGDYVIRGVNGEFYPCKPDIFAKTYKEYDGESTEVYNCWTKADNPPKDRNWYLGTFQEVDTGWVIPIPFVCFYLGEESKYTTQNFWVIKDMDESLVEYYKRLKCVAWTSLPPQYRG